MLHALMVRVRGLRPKFHSMGNQPALVFSGMDHDAVALLELAERGRRITSQELCFFIHDNCDDFVGRRFNGNRILLDSCHSAHYVLFTAVCNCQDGK